MTNSWGKKAWQGALLGTLLFSGGTILGVAGYSLGKRQGITLGREGQAAIAPQAQQNCAKAQEPPKSLLHFPEQKQLVPASELQKPRLKDVARAWEIQGRLACHSEGFR